MRSARFDAFWWAASTAAWQIRSALFLCAAVLLAACGQQAGYGVGGAPYGEIGPTGAGEVPQQYYAPPGPPADPWGPYIREAAADYRVPEQWIRAVMQQESGGEEQAVSPVGAMGLMQIMPETYEGLRERYGFGADPFNPHDNIRAGAAYMREMYDLFGSPGFLAAYNAGPDRVDSYLGGTSRLPLETVNYVAAIAPNLGDAVPPSGPMAAYAYARPPRRMTGISVASLAAGCNLDAAYDPNHPCTSLEQAATAAAPPDETVAQRTGVEGCNLDAAYDPNHPCTSVPQVATASGPSQPPVPAAALQVAAVSVPPPQVAASPAPRQLPAEPAEPEARLELASADAPSLLEEASVSRYRAAPRHLPVVAARDWAIQVGAFVSPALARRVAEGARHQAPKELRYAALNLPTTAYRHRVLYRARLSHLSERAAADACSYLNRRQLPCVVVRPGRT